MSSKTNNDEIQQTSSSPPLNVPNEKEKVPNENVPNEKRFPNEKENQMQAQIVKISTTNNQNFSLANALSLANLKLDSELVTCPNCGFVGKSIVTTKCSWSNCCCCWCTCLVFWICFQLCRNKALCCRDADHRCSKCGTLLAHYEAC